jgi:anion-transporting  ArsA/GET3 family ATPase
MQRLYELHNSGRYDLIVVDTPPTRNALDFLDAPERMAEFFSSRLLRWLIAPYRSRVVGFASKPFYSVADRILGTQFLEDIAEFFILFQSMYDGFVERARAVTELLGSPQTTFLVVSTLEVAPSREAAYFLSLLAERRYHVGALVLNKVLPDLLLGKPATESARTLAKHGAEVGAELDEQLSLGMPHTGSVLTEIGRSFLDYQVVARREGEQRRELSAIPDLTLTVPYFDDDIHSLEGLLRLGRGIWS